MALKSGFEKTIKSFLEGLGIKHWYEPLSLPYVQESTYKPDFVIYKGKLKKVKKPLTPDELQGMILVETKGFLDIESRKKMIAVKQQYPQLDIRILFQKDGFVYKSKKGRREKGSTDFRYSDWAKKHGFTYAIGEEIPKEWLQ